MGKDWSLWRAHRFCSQTLGADLRPIYSIGYFSFVIAFLLNAAIFYRRYNDLYTQTTSLAPWIWIGIEACMEWLLAAALLLLARLLGRWIYAIGSFFLLACSVLASYYMTFFNVVIGYGVLQAVLTTDVDLSKEAVGMGLLIWTGLWLIFIYGLAYWLGLLPLSHKDWRLPKSKSSKSLSISKWIAGTLVLGALILALSSLVAWFNKNAKVSSLQASSVKAATIVAHSYVPSNWVAGLGLSLSNAWQQWRNDDKKIQPAQKFNYTSQDSMQGVFVVVVIGETSKGSHFEVLGYPRPTSPHMVANKQLAAFAAHSCDTSTKLSLQCMFVRPESVQDMGLETTRYTEDNVFSVLKHLGFGIELFALQSEVWFYNSLGASQYKIREVIAADPKNANKPTHDMLLVPELQDAIARHPQGKQVLVLHTKGSHYLYTSRYPRSFVRFTPECHDQRYRAAKPFYLRMIL